jgi:2-polyprenyl-6-methoxyphenol hydroxylase-like FAD-dependent oxidoreductase
MLTQQSNSGFQGHVLIIGGGIGGSALALFLKKAGISSTVYEAYPYKDGVGGGLGLAPNGMNVLDALGLAERTKARGSLGLENVFYNEHGRILARFKNGDSEQYGQSAVSLLRPALYDVLTEALVEQGVKVEYEKRLERISTNGTKVTAHFEDGTSAEGDLLVGADGIHSQTRRFLLPDGPEPAFVGIISISGVAPSSAVPAMSQRDKQSFTFTYGANGFFGYSGVENGDVMWWSNLPRERELTQAELMDDSLESVQREMLAVYRGYHDPIETLIRNTHSPVKFNIHDIQSLPRWHQDRVILIGDAAHAVSPNAGQGAAMALEDAMYLARLLRHTDCYQQAFAQFEADRKPRVEKIVAEGRRRGNDKQIVSPWQQKVRELMMMIFLNLFGIKGQDWLYGYKIAWD